MTVSAGETSYSQWTGNGVTTDFDYQFKVSNEEDLLVVTTDPVTGLETTLVLGTGYTVTNVGKNEGGKVKLTTALTDTHLITISDNVDVSQDTPFGNQSQFFAASHENAFDKLTRLVKRLFNKLSRTISAPLSDPDSVNMELPSSVDRANTILTFGASGEVIASTTIPGSTVFNQSTIGQTLWPRTAAEIAASVTPTYYYYKPGYVERYGAVADSTQATPATDCTQAFKDAFAQAVESGGAAVRAAESWDNSAGAGGTKYGYRLTEAELNFRYPRVELGDTLIILDFDGIGIRIGGNGNGGQNPDQYWGQVLRSDTYDDIRGDDYDNFSKPTIRIVGAYEQYISIRTSRYIQVYCDNDSGQTDTANRHWVSYYGRVKIHKCNELCLAGNASSDEGLGGTQSINDMAFEMNRVRRVSIIKGTYSHNNNHFYGGNYEGDKWDKIDKSCHIKIDGCTCNTFHDMRCEGYSNQLIASSSTSGDVGVTASGGAFTVTLEYEADADRFVDGKIIGFDLDAGGKWYTTCNGDPSGAVVTITDALPSTVSAGNSVYTKTGPNVSFLNNASFNIVEQSWVSSISHYEAGTWYNAPVDPWTDNGNPPAKIVDNGRGNRILHRTMRDCKTISLGKASADDVVLDNQVLYPNRETRLGAVVASSTDGGFLETRRIRVFPGDVIRFHARALGDTAQDRYDTADAYRLRVFCYDKNGRHFDPVDDTHFETSNLGVSGTAGEQYIQRQSDGSEAGLVVKSEDWHWATCKLYGGDATNHAYEVWLTLRRPYRDRHSFEKLHGEEQAIITQSSPHAVTAKPSEGFAPVGYRATDGTNTWTVTKSVDTWLTTAAAGAANTIIVQADVTSFGLNDIVGILNDDNYVTDWTTLTGTPTGTGPYTCQLAAGLTDACAIGNRVVFMEWT